VAFEQIRFDTVDGVATITLNRPERLCGSCLLPSISPTLTMPSAR
jgi:enoyl-CoA hydratase/carnithine racemase